MAAAKSVSLPEPLLAQIQSAAQAEERSVDEVLTDAVKRYIEERSWTKLMDYGAERAKTLGGGFGWSGGWSCSCRNQRATFPSHFLRAISA